MIRAAIFDMDGLLFDTERLCCEAWRTVASASGLTMDDGLFFSCVGRNNRDTREIVTAAMGSGFPYEQFVLQSREWMKERMTVNGPPEKAGIRPLFDFLQDRGVLLGLATSTSEASARWMIERAGLTGRFSAMAFGSEVERGKPEPDIFLLALGRLGRFEPADCAVFEDSPAGIRAAHAAGMKPVLVPDLVIPEPAVRGLAWKVTDRLDRAADDGFWL